MVLGSYLFTQSDINKNAWSRRCRNKKMGTTVEYFHAVFWEFLKSKGKSHFLCI